MSKFVRFAAPVAVLSGFVATAHAALPADVNTAITAYKTDSLSAIGLLLAAGIAIYALKKLATKMGWL